MAELWEMGLKGETRLEKAAEYAWKSKEPWPLFSCLMDEEYYLDLRDRAILACFVRDLIIGHSLRGRGRLAKDEMTFGQRQKEFDRLNQQRRNVDRAERLYRYIIDRRRKYKGARVRGARAELIPRIAKLCKIDARSLLARLHK